MTKENYIQQHANLFWYTPADKKQDISDALLVETILNYGILNDYRSLLSVLTPQRVAEVFLAHLNGKRRTIIPRFITFFHYY